jgi:hypothetical protein
MKGRWMLDKIADFSRNFRKLAHGDYQDAKHLADYVALISRVIFLAALSAIILKHAADKIMFYPLAFGMALLVIHLMKHLYWMTYDYISSWLGDSPENGREAFVFFCSLVVTIILITGITSLYVDILTSSINIGAWITTHDQP